MSRDGLVGVVTRLDVRELVVRFPAGTRDLSLLKSAQTDSGGHPAFHSMDAGEAVSPRVKRPGREAHHYPHLAPSLEVSGAVTSLPTTPT